MIAAAFCSEFGGEGGGGSGGEGRSEGFGTVREVLTRDAMARVWQMDVAGWMLETLEGWREV